MKGRRIAVLAVAIVLSAATGILQAQEPEAQVADIYRQDRVVVARLELPDEGQWTVEQPPLASPLRFVVFRDGTVAGLLVREEARVDLTVVNRTSGRRLTAVLPIGEAKQIEELGDLSEEWARERALRWAEFYRAQPTFSLRAWLEAQNRIYGLNIDIEDLEDGRRGRRRRRRGRQTSIFNLMGGRAAVRETLQLQLLEDRGQDADKGKRTVPIHTIEGVTVESHPFEEMLGGKPGGELELARAVPMNRFFIHLRQPARVLRLLDSGASFASKVGDYLSAVALEYGLPERYMGRLGLTEHWARQFIEAGAVREVGVFTPDLFFIDGTELTVVCRVPQMDAVARMLAKLGVRGLDQGTPVGVSTTAGNQAWWLSRGDLLVLSTHRDEAMDAAALIDNDGAGSLGDSAEFRYMLTQVPVKEQTAAYAYFSDPFIRRLVGPEVKIGQLRRIQARGRLEMLGAMAMLYRAEGRQGQPTLAALKEHDYLPTGWPDSYTLEGMKPVSEKWGSPRAMKSLLENKPASATPLEARTYGNYVEAYSRFWRRFFDPIALRLDLSGSQSAELTTFILPLLDSEMYNQVRRFVASAEVAGPLKVPTLDPSPVLMASVAPSQMAWKKFMEEAGEQGLEELRNGLNVAVDPAILDHLGPRVHFALLDYEPVVSMGSGDLLGMFGSNILGGDPEEVLGIMAIVTSLLRPARLLVEVDDPEAVRGIISRVKTAGKGPDWEVQFGEQWYRITGEDRWIYTVSLLDILTLRYSVEVAGDYLVISSLPWGRPTRVTETRTLPLAAAGLGVFPGAVHEEAPMLQAAAMEKLREAVFGASNLMMPAMLATGGDPEAARQLHRTAFGFQPVHPGSGNWSWQDGYPVSSTYGRPSRPRQPAAGRDDPAVGLMGGLQSLDVSFQLEGDGLRSVMRWTWGEPEE